MKTVKGGAAAEQTSSSRGATLSRLALFDHLPRKSTLRSSDLVEYDRILHPATIKLGGLYSKGHVLNDDDRVTSLLAAFVTVIQDYKTPPNKILREDLDRYLSKQVQFLVECRQLSRGMGNLIKFVRFSISKITPETSEAEAKEELMRRLQAFLEERLLYAAEHISTYVASAIRDNDVILTFGSSPLIRQVLLSVAQVREFRLVVIDSRPLNEGLATLTALSHKVHCVYSPLSGAAAAMKDQQVTHVLLGASSLQCNGTMLAPAGTAMVAALAKAWQIPVIVAAESYKFSEKVQLDSIVYNEMGKAAEISVMQLESEEVGAKYVPVPQRQPGYRGAADSTDETGEELDPIALPSQWGNVSSPSQQLPFSVVNLRYDVTPMVNISVVATETGLIPPTSLPVLMREIQSDMLLSSAANPASVATAGQHGLDPLSL
ncbi:hypothetical protein B484DRAFT_417378 [Ochromonadaceae sp. CCMP2298]|nr:hypothetical protein B484DRAFT_417378 [Ochromonadaceae sp. CCMP2298]